MQVIRRGTGSSAPRLRQSAEYSGKITEYPTGLGLEMPLNLRCWYFEALHARYNQSLIHVYILLWVEPFDQARLSNWRLGAGVPAVFGVTPYTTLHTLFWRRESQRCETKYWVRAFLQTLSGFT